MQQFIFARSHKNSFRRVTKYPLYDETYIQTKAPAHVVYAKNIHNTLSQKLRTMFFITYQDKTQEIPLPKLSIKKD